MNNRATCAVAGLLLGVWICVGGVSRASGDQPRFTFSKGVLTIRTGRYTVTWERGCMTRLVSPHTTASEWTVRDGQMRVTQLPNGLGSFHKHPKGKCRQHHVVFGHKLSKPVSFPAQHPVGPTSTVRCERITGGVRLMYKGLTGDATAELVQELTVEPDTGELVIRQRGRSRHSGVFGISFSLLNLRPDITFAVPYFGGQRFGGTIHRGRIVGYAWPKFWAAGFVVGEVPGGGSFIVYADDPRLRAKYFKLYNTEAVQGLSFEACTDAPYHDKTEAKVCAWRFNTYPGSWTEPAETYKRWLAKTYDLEPRRDRATRWTDDIALVWPKGLNLKQLETMAEKIDPKRVLILDLGWAKGFNRNCPHYQPRNQKLEEQLAAAHKLGYRYGVYCGQKLLDRHAHTDLFKRFGLALAYDRLYRDEARLKKTRETQQAVLAGKKAGHFLAIIHAGRDQWITHYADVIEGFHKTYGIDLFYEDVTGANCTATDVLDGRTLHEGTVACDLEIRKRMPQVALAGEFWTEVNVACAQEFGLSTFMAWFGEEHRKRLARLGHPILSYVFSDFCSYISYRTPVRSGAKWHWDQHCLEVMGAPPVWRTFINDSGSEARVCLERAKLFAEGYRPYFPKTRAKGVVAHMRNPAGRVVKYVRDGWSSLCFDETSQGDRLRYGRLKDKTSLAIDEPVTIDGWVAYGPRGPIGLDPSRWTCVFPGRPTDLPAKITALPPGVYVSGTRLADDYCLVQLGGTGRGTLHWTAIKKDVGLMVGTRRVPAGSDKATVQAPGVLLFGVGRAPDMAIGQALPLEDWHTILVAHGTVIGPTTFYYPPTYRKLGDTRLKGYGVFPFAGGSGAEMSIDGRVRLPDDKRVALAFHMGRTGGAGDGVHFVVRVNGAPVWKAFSEPNKRAWTPGVVPLGDYAGRDVVLSLALDAGPSGFNLSNDQALWGEPKLIRQEP